MGKQLQAALAKCKRTGAKFLIAVDRNSIELTEITVPPAADAELPEMVLNQLAMDAPAIADESVVDFIASPGEANHPARSRPRRYQRRNSTGSMPSARLREFLPTECSFASMKPRRCFSIGR